MKVLFFFVLLQGAAGLGVQTPPTLLRPLPAGVILTISDLQGTPSLVAELEGKATRRFMPAGAVIRAADVRAPILVARNALVRLQYQSGALSITAEGRALSDGAMGESVRVISGSSKAPIVGTVTGEGLVQLK